MASNLALDSFTSFPGFPHRTNVPSSLTSTISTATTLLSKSILTSKSTPAESNPTPHATQSKSTDSNPWNNMSKVAHHVVVAGAIIGTIIAICIFFWFLRERRKRAHTPPNSAQPDALPLYNLQAPPTVSRFTGGGRPPGTPRARAPGGDAPPPSYEEVVPPHLRVVTGPPRIIHGGDAEDGMVADGKTPLSEIPFEDVMLEPSSSSSSMNSANQAFGAVHHNGVGDTRGHTNS